ncbi:MAG: hypothetical protein AAGA01_17020, partial [Cyanobacteria bacterium P01_E01_bin.43]
MRQIYPPSKPMLIAQFLAELDHNAGGSSHPNQGCQDRIIFSSQVSPIRPTEMSEQDTRGQPSARQFCKQFLSKLLSRTVICFRRFTIFKSTCTSGQM